MAQSGRLDAFRNLFVIVAAACALVLSFVVNRQTSKLGTKVQVEQQRTQAWLGRVAVLGYPVLPADFPDSFVDYRRLPEVHATMKLYESDDTTLLLMAKEHLDTMVANDSIPALSALQGLYLIRLKDRPNALERLVWAGMHARKDEDGVRLVAYGYAGLILADSGFHLDDTAQGHSLLRRAQDYYDTALTYDAAGLITTLYIVSWRERVRKELGEDEKSIARTEPSTAVRRFFIVGLVCCLVGFVAAAVALFRPRSG